MGCKGLVFRKLPAAIVLTMLVTTAEPADAQTPPDAAQAATYKGLQRAAHRGDVPTVKRLARSAAARNERDANGRTALHIATFARRYVAVRILLDAGSNINALDKQRYDALTIAAVANDLEMVTLLLARGANPKAVTSPYDGTALIASSHLGHVEVVRALIDAGAPLDHINNLGWTALLEAVILGDGGPRHTAIVKALRDAGANAKIGDRQGATPLDHARRRGFSSIVALLET